MCPVCSVRAKLPDRPELPVGKEEEGIVITVPCIEHHDVPLAMLEAIHMVYRNGLLVQPGKHNDYTVDLGEVIARVSWNIPLEQWEQVCVFCPATGSRWAWSPHCGVFVDIRR